MNDSLFFTLMLALVLGCEGCKKGENKTNEDNLGTGMDPIGIAECDAYFKRAEECVSKSPSLQTSMGTTLRHNHDNWKKLASSPQGKETLRGTCKSALDALSATCP